MIISFFGHSDFCEKNGDREKMREMMRLSTERRKRFDKKKKL